MTSKWTVHSNFNFDSFSSLLENLEKSLSQEIEEECKEYMIEYESVLKEFDVGIYIDRENGELLEQYLSHEPQEPQEPLELQQSQQQKKRQSQNYQERILNLPSLASLPSITFSFSSSIVDSIQSNNPLIQLEQLQKVIKKQLEKQKTEFSSQAELFSVDAISALFNDSSFCSIDGVSDATTTTTTTTITKKTTSKIDNSDMGSIRNDNKSSHNELGSKSEILFQLRPHHSQNASSIQHALHFSKYTESESVPIYIRSNVLTKQQQPQPQPQPQPQLQTQTQKQTQTQSQTQIKLKSQSQPQPQPQTPPQSQQQQQPYFLPLFRLSTKIKKTINKSSNIRRQSKSFPSSSRENGLYTEGQNNSNENVNVIAKEKSNNMHMGQNNSTNSNTNANDYNNNNSNSNSNSNNNNNDNDYDDDNNDNGNKVRNNINKTDDVNNFNGTNAKKSLKNKKEKEKENKENIERSFGRATSLRIKKSLKRKSKEEEKTDNLVFQTNGELMKFDQQSDRSIVVRPRETLAFLKQSSEDEIYAELQATDEIYQESIPTSYVAEDSNSLYSKLHTSGNDIQEETIHDGDNTSVTFSKMNSVTGSVTLFACNDRYECGFDSSEKTLLTTMETNLHSSTENLYQLPDDFSSYPLRSSFTANAGNDGNGENFIFSRGRSQSDVLSVRLSGLLSELSQKKIDSIPETMTSNLARHRSNSLEESRKLSLHNSANSNLNISKTSISTATPTLTRTRTTPLPSTTKATSSSPSSEPLPSTSTSTSSSLSPSRKVKRSFSLNASKKYFHKKNNSIIMDSLENVNNNTNTTNSNLSNYNSCHNNHNNNHNNNYTDSYNNDNSNGNINNNYNNNSNDNDKNNNNNSNDNYNQRKPRRSTLPTVMTPSKNALSSSVTSIGKGRPRTTENPALDRPPLPPSPPSSPPLPTSTSYQTKIKQMVRKMSLPSKSSSSYSIDASTKKIAKNDKLANANEKDDRDKGKVMTAGTSASAPVICSTTSSLSSSSSSSSASRPLPIPGSSLSNRDLHENNNSTATISTNNNYKNYIDNNNDINNNHNDIYYRSKTSVASTGSQNVTILPMKLRKAAPQLMKMGDSAIENGCKNRIDNNNNYNNDKDKENCHFLHEYDHLSDTFDKQKHVDKPLDAKKDDVTIAPFLDNDEFTPDHYKVVDMKTEEGSNNGKRNVKRGKSFGSNFKRNFCL
eukprot:Awhi_evm1s1447